MDQPWFHFQVILDLYFLPCPMFFHPISLWTSKLFSSSFSPRNPFSHPPLHYHFLLLPAHLHPKSVQFLNHPKFHVYVVLQVFYTSPCARCQLCNHISWPQRQVPHQCAPKNFHLQLLCSKLEMKANLCN